MEDLVIENILESMTDSLIVIGAKGEIIYTNSATGTVLGCDIHELKRVGLGMTFFCMEQNVAFNQIFIDAIQNKSVQSYAEVPYMQPDGTLKKLSATTSYLVRPKEDDQEFLGIIAIFKDISEISDLREREKCLLEAREKASQEQVKALQKLAAGVAHEIRNPIVTIGGFAARIMKRSDTTDSVGRQTQFILDNARKLESVVDEVQRYCNINAVLQNSVVFTKIVEESILRVADKMGAKEMASVFEKTTTTNTECNCDPDLLTTALEELLENAIYFAPEKSIITLTLSDTPKELSLVIRDQGPGISAVDVDFIFNPFFSTRADKPGMGLPTVLRIIHQHMGSIAVESKNGSGTSFTMKLPRSSGQN